MKRYNVLVFPGGTEIGLEIQRALRYCKEIRLFSAGTDVPNHAPFVFRRHFVLPSIHESGWLEALNRLIEHHRIDFVYPAYDDVIVALATHAEEIRARIVSSPLETCLITRSKSKTYRHFEGILPVPRMFGPAGPIPEFPVFVKPDQGQGSQGTTIASNGEELTVALTRDPTALVLEYLPGEEFTVDCFSDRERGLMFYGGRRRERTRAGISMTSSPVRDDAFGEFAAKIVDHLEIHGAWFFQVRKDRQDGYKLLEIGPRVAGTMALHRVAGVNFPLLSILEQDRVPLELLTLDGVVRIDRALTNRYRHTLTFRTVYVDLDDTLILDDRVNVAVVRFLFQCLNEGKTLVLLTRHASDVAETLERFRLSTLFDEVLHLDADTPKSSMIRDSDAIFLDDSFRERQDVHRNCGIPVLDTSMLELLIDHRM